MLYIYNYIFRNQIHIFYIATTSKDKNYMLVGKGNALLALPFMLIDPNIYIYICLHPILICQYIHHLVVLIDQAFLSSSILCLRYNLKQEDTFLPAGN